MTTLPTPTLTAQAYETAGDRFLAAIKALSDARLAVSAAEAERDAAEENLRRFETRPGIPRPECRGAREVDTLLRPAAQAERDRLMPQACGECGGEVPFDGAPPDHLGDCEGAVPDRASLDAEALDDIAALLRDEAGEGLSDEDLRHAITDIVGLSGRITDSCGPNDDGPYDTLREMRERA